MGWYAAKRVLQAIPLLLGIATITSFMVRLAPGDPMFMYLERQQDRRDVDPRVIELVRQKYGLDQPLPVQYVKWMGNLARGDLGESFRYRRPVASLRVWVLGNPEKRVGASGRWYQRVLNCQSGHGGPEYERLVAEGEYCRDHAGVFA